MDSNIKEIPDAFSKLIKKLEEKGIQFNNMKAIEMFSRTGNLQTIYYADKVNSLEAWEIDPQWEDELRKNLPNAKIMIGDSIDYLKNSPNRTTYDFIVIDAPLNNFGEKIGTLTAGPYCEHFDFIKDVGNFIDKRAIVVFNINNRPYSYEKWPELKKRREKFYGSNVDTSNLDIDFLLEFYKNLFLEVGLKTNFHIDVPRALYNGIDWFHYLAYGLEKI